jgi:hypothetical protein
VSGFYRRDLRSHVILYFPPAILLLLALDVFFPHSFSILIPDPVDTVLIIVVIVLSVSWLYELNQRPKLRFELSRATAERPYAAIEVSNRGAVVAKSDMEMRIDGTLQDGKGAPFAPLWLPIFTGMDIEPKERGPPSFQLRYLITFAYHTSTNSFRLHWENRDPRRKAEDEVQVQELPKGQYRVRLVTKWENFGKRQILSRQYRLTASAEGLPVLKLDRNIAR